MNMTELDTFSNLLVNAALRGIYVPTVIWGEAGVGKSQAVARTAKRLGMKFVDLRLGSMDVGDFMGLPEITTDEHGVRRTSYAKPVFFPEDDGSTGIIFLDEMNRSHRDVRAPMFQFILDRRLGEYKLPDGWIIIAACNPAGENYEVDDSYDKAFMARFCHVNLTPTTEEWLTWADANAVHWSVRAFAEMNPGYMGLDTCPLPKIFPTPRTMAMLSDLLDAGLPADLQLEVAMGLLGTEAAPLWAAAAVTRERPVKGADVLERWETVEETIYTQTAQARMDLLKATLDEVVTITEGDTWDAAWMDSLICFMTSIPVDLGYGALRMHFARNPRLVDALGDNEDVVEWAEEVAALATAAE